jgi:hypothetical protein
MRRLDSAAVFVTSLAVLTPAAWADCTTVPGNELTTNCGFESGNPPAGWTKTSIGGFFLRNTTIYRSGTASGEVRAPMPPPSFGTFAAVQSACFPVTPGAGYGFGGFFRLRSGSVGPCQTTIRWYPDGTCTTPTSNVQSPLAFINTTSWTRSAALATTGGTHARLTLVCNGIAEFAMVVDDAFAGPGLTTPVELLSVSVD